MTISGYSQGLYPKKILFQNDTVIAITPEQLRAANIKMLEGGYYRSVNDTLLSERAQYIRSINNYRVIVQQQSDLKDIADKRIENLLLQLENSKGINESIKKKADRDLWRDRGLFTLLGFVLAVIVI